MKKTNYGNVIDYLNWRGDLTFQQSPFNEVDGLILSILAYLDYAYCEPNTITFYHDVVERMERTPENEHYDVPIFMEDMLLDFPAKVAATARFRDMGVAYYVDHRDLDRELQFAAITFLLPDGTAFLAFRGTDNSLVGWKEDFNMSFVTSLPAHEEAQRYAQRVLEDLTMPFRMGGHSKGGNLAIWAAAHLSDEEKERLLDIYENDSPGFREEFANGPLYGSIRDKIRSFVPQSSIVGILMEHDDYITIQSSKAAAMQHEPFSWYVLGDHFIYDENRSKSGQTFDKVLNSWIRSMSMEEREAFVNNLYEVIVASEAKSLADLDRNKLHSLLLMQKSFREMDKEKQFHIVHGLIKIFFNEDTKANHKFISKLMDHNPDKTRFASFIAD